MRCIYETVDGEIFYNKRDAINHEIDLYPNFKIPEEIRHIFFTNFRLVWLDSPTFEKCDVREVEWEGKGYYCVMLIDDYGKRCIPTFKKFTTNIVKIINDFVNKAIEIEKTQISISETSEIFDDVGEESEIDVDSDNRSGNEDEDEYISDGFDELDYDIDESDFDDDEDED